MDDVRTEYVRHCADEEDTGGEHVVARGSRHCEKSRSVGQPQLEAFEREPRTGVANQIATGQERPT